MSKRLLYFIGFTVRSGSSLLCGMLNSTNVAGHAHEHYHQIKQPTVAEGWERFKGRDLGIKLNIRQIRELWPLACEECDPPLILLRRKNRWQAAVSAYRAIHSGVWVSPVEGYRVKGRNYDQGDVPFCEEPIIREYRIIRHEEQQWESWLTEMSLSPLRIYYEDLAEHPVEVACLCLGYLRLPYVGPIVQTTRKQRTPETEEWAARMYDKYGDSP